MSSRQMLLCAGQRWKVLQSINYSGWQVNKQPGSLHVINNYEHLDINYSSTINLCTCEPCTPGLQWKKMKKVSGLLPVYRNKNAISGMAVVPSFMVTSSAGAFRQSVTLQTDYDLSAH